MQSMKKSTRNAHEPVGTRSDGFLLRDRDHKIDIVEYH